MRRGRVLILLGLILAIGAAAIVFMLLQTTAQAPTVAEVPREEVVVAKQPIAEDEPVAERLEVREVPSEMVQEGALRTLDGTQTMLAKGPIPQGSIVYQEMLQTPEEQMAEGNLSQLVEAGHVAMAFPITELSSVSYGIQPGDYVDVLMTLAFIDVDQETQMEQPICPPLCPTGGETQAQAQAGGQLERLVAQVTLQDILVLGVGRWLNEVEPPPEQTAPGADEGTAAIPPEYITLMLEPQDALVLKLAREQGASIDLAVRNVDDHQTFQNIQQVTMDYIMARFGISLPPKHEYTIELLQPK
jgi:Flp pilus assembly protein CpaB